MLTSKTRLLVAGGGLGELVAAASAAAADIPVNLVVAPLAAEDDFWLNLAPGHACLMAMISGELYARLRAEAIEWPGYFVKCAEDKHPWTIDFRQLSRRISLGLRLPYSAFFATTLRFLRDAGARVDVSAGPVTLASPNGMDRQGGVSATDVGGLQCRWGASFSQCADIAVVGHDVVAASGGARLAGVDQGYSEEPIVRAVFSACRTLENGFDFALCASQHGDGWLSVSGIGEGQIEVIAHGHFGSTATAASREKAAPDEMLRSLIRESRTVSRLVDGATLVSCRSTTYRRFSAAPASPAPQVFTIGGAVASGPSSALGIDVHRTVFDGFVLGQIAAENLASRTHGGNASATSTERLRALQHARERFGTNFWRAPSRPGMLAAVARRDGEKVPSLARGASLCYEASGYAEADWILSGVPYVKNKTEWGKFDRIPAEAELRFHPYPPERMRDRLEY